MSRGKGRSMSVVITFNIFSVEEVVGSTAQSSSLWHKIRSLVNPLKTRRNLFYLKTQFVPRCKHFLSRLKKTKEFMLYKAEVTVCCNINTIRINTVWAECRVSEC